MDVLIESDWNLKIEEVWSICERFYVLIESDWNLKDTKDCIIVVPAGINRIRLEFKGSEKQSSSILHRSVLIESDWNLRII